MPDESCFVIMPFGDKVDADGTPIDFNVVYSYVIKPAVKEVGLQPIRCDEVEKPGWIHAEMITRIFDADVAVVDVTTLNPNVFYELGVRHALRKSVTVLVRRKGTKIPFNIEGLNLIEYELTDPVILDEAKRKIGEFIKAGLHGTSGDSLVHQVLPLRIDTAPKAAKRAILRYSFNAVPDKTLCVIAGDIQNVKDVDIWVSSENTDMQMARFFDRSISSVIRYLGAEKDEAGHVTKDVIAESLAAKLGTHSSVAPATILETTPGQLAETHSVKRLFHAAAVTGALGHGYVPIANVSDCVTNALRRSDLSQLPGYGAASVLFPLMGTGTAQGDLQTIVATLFDAAIEYLVHNPESVITRACFVVWSEAELTACQAYLDRSSAVTLQG
jgi:O-acetyl-ADP-ribose deacetylase (regulator of RNase III)